MHALPSILHAVASIIVVEILEVVYASVEAYVRTTWKYFLRSTI